MVGFFEWLNNVFNPCLHVWEEVETLKDDDEHPTAVTIIRRCISCGEVKSETFNAPKGSKVCPPHLWVDLPTVEVFSGTSKTVNALPVARVYMKECTRCGEMKEHKVSYTKV